MDSFELIARQSLGWCRVFRLLPEITLHIPTYVLRSNLILSAAMLHESNRDVKLFSNLCFTGASRLSCACINYRRGSS